MSALVGYGSSDDEDDIDKERPTKMAKLDHNEALPSGKGAIKFETSLTQARPKPTPATSQPPSFPDNTEPQTQPAGPSRPPPPTDDHAALSTSAPASPYTAERLQIRSLTMPPIPNFDIPSSPTSHSPNSEAAATLAATTKKFSHFLDLKKKGVHFNQRLQSSTSLRNPSLLPKLMEFAGISLEESYASTLSVEQGGVPGRWPEGWYVEDLVKGNERREKKRSEGRGSVGFVTAKQGGVEAVPKGGTGKVNVSDASGGIVRKSRFDQ